MVSSLMAAGRGKRTGEVPVAICAVKQVAAYARRPAVCADIPILATKITAPGVPDWAVPRPRITKLIAQGSRRGPLTVVTGPAGAGKTTALALWAAVEPVAVAWVTVDEYDNRPGVFWSYVAAALRRSGITVPEVPPAARGREASHICLLRRSEEHTSELLSHSDLVCRLLLEIKNNESRPIHLHHTART